jgi:hypothetical protein
MKTLTITLLLAATVVRAAPETGATEAEIRHLLDFVAQADVVFVRNGKDHTAKEAVDHMKKKRDHFAGKGKVKTAEDFITYAGTKSLLSGKLYQVRLPDGTTRPCADWLTAELKRYRTAGR